MSFFDGGRSLRALLAAVLLFAAAAQAAGQRTESEARKSRQNLIDLVEKAYASGEAAYRKGRLPEARAEFDRAIDLMLSSGFDITGDPQLNDEFTRTLDRITAFETEALREGTGFTPKTEETPADVAEEVTFQPDPAILAKARAELKTTKSDLPLVINDYVASFINFFANTQKGHNTLLHSFQRAGRYRAMIERILAEEGVPHDLIFLAVAESGFQPTAVNRRSRAGGMWQFMPSGQYGLVRNQWVDERFDPEKSTRAYARYMKFIYAQLGDWYLSMAAYDWGTGNVQRAVQKTGYADFWELYKRNNLPGETKNYVPEILAAIIIARNPSQYGFDEITFDPPVLTDTVTINYPVDLRLVADIINAPVEQLEALNPSLLRRVTPPDGPFDLHLPAGTAGLFEQRIALVPVEHRNAWRYHRLAPGETLASVARDAHVSLAALEEANQITPGKGDAASGIAGPEAVLIPQAPQAAAPAAHAQFYSVRRGDTLVTIADRFNVSPDQLRRWNHLSGNKVAAGQRLRVAGQPGAAQSSHHHHGGGKAGASKTATGKAGSGKAQAAKQPGQSATSRQAKTHTGKKSQKK